LKRLFNPDNLWLYGNLSPLVHIEDVEQNKELYVTYAIETNKAFKEMQNSTLRKITEFYKIKLNQIPDVDKMEKIIKNRLSKLV